MAKESYVGIESVARKVKQPYVGIGSVARAVNNGYVGIDGVARQFYQSGVPISSLADGARILYGGNYYTLIAHDYIETGDVVLWEETATGSGKPSRSTSTTASTFATSNTPFGTSNTNQGTIYYKYYSSTSASKPSKGSYTGYGWALCGNTAGYEVSYEVIIYGNTTETYGSPEMDYIQSRAARTRATDYWIPDSLAEDDGADYHYIATGTGYYTSVRSTSVKDIYFAYSIDGTLLASENSDGTYTLLI